MTATRDHVNPFPTRHGISHLIWNDISFYDEFQCVECGILLTTLPNLNSVVIVKTNILGQQVSSKRIRTNITRKWGLFHWIVGLFYAIA